MNNLKMVLSTIYSKGESRIDQNATACRNATGAEPSELVLVCNSFTKVWYNLFSQNCIPAQGCLGTDALHTT